jgi:hypothetical protein
MPAILQTPPAPPRTSRRIPASPNAPQVTCTNRLRQCPPSLNVPACFGLSRAARRRAEGSRREIPGHRLTRDSPFRCRVVATWPQETDDGSAAEPRQTPSSTPASEHTSREVGHYSSVGELRDRVCAPHRRSGLSASLAFAERNKPGRGAARPRRRRSRGRRPRPGHRPCRAGARRRPSWWIPSSRGPGPDRPGRDPTQPRQSRAGHHNAERALAVHAETGHRLGRARAHLVADHAHRAVGDDRKAHTHQRRARALFTEIGAPWPITPAPSSATRTVARPSVDLSKLPTNPAALRCGWSRPPRGRVSKRSPHIPAEGGEHPASIPTAGPTRLVIRSTQPRLDRTSPIHSAHPSKPFCADVKGLLGSEQPEQFTKGV